MSARVIEVLEKFVAPTAARDVYQRALLDLARGGRGNTDLRFVDRLVFSAADWLGPSDSDRLRQDLEGVLSPDRTSARVVHRFEIRDEADARRARMATRQLCVEAGLATLEALRLATNIGELSTGVVSDNGEGSVELVITAGHPQKAHVRVPRST